MSGRPFLVAALLLTLILVPPLARGALDSLPAYAEPQRLTTAAGSADVRTAAETSALSNENERQDREERRGREDNQSDDNEDDDWRPPPPPRQPPPPPPPTQVQACLSGGESLTLRLDDGGVAVRVFQSGLSVELARVDAGSVPAPPGGVVGDLVFRLAAAPCGGAALTELPHAVNLGVAYRNRIGERVDESRLTLLFYDGQSWTAAPGAQPDPPNNYVSASVTALGVYAVTAR